MILNIDTNEESSQRLRQIAKFLNELANNSSVETSTETSSDEPDTPAFDMFDMSSDELKDVKKKPSSDDNDDDVFKMIPY